MPVTAHEQAWLKKKYIHRDISTGNILLFFFIDVEGNLQVIGVLNDWDLCKAHKYLTKISRPARSVSSFNFTGPSTAHVDWT